MESNSYSAAVEEIKSRCNIVDLISPLVPLKRAGSNYKGCCPFHKEKTPSFVVSESRQTYHCFGCGEHGDAFKFIEKYYNKTFPEAVEQLAKQYGVEIDTVYARQGKKKEPYYEANRLAARFFYSGICAKGNRGFEYMRGRGIEPATIKKFGIGYADAEWDSLSGFLKKQGIDEGMLKEISLARTSQKSGKLYDFFRDRVIFPIINTQGRVIGFGGRILGDGEPKYLNSLESLIFQKGQNLFGLNLTRSEIQKEGFAIMVEGYMDVVGLYQAGVKNVAASLGTALTEQQARLLARYTQKAVLCYDADNAGRKAALRGIDVLRNAGLEVRVMHVEDGKDPDEYVKKHGRAEFIEMMNRVSKSDIDYKVSVIAEGCDMQSTDGRLRFFRRAAEDLSKLSPVESELYIKKVAADYGFSEGALRNQVQGDASAKASQPQPRPRDSGEGEEEAPPGTVYSEADVMLEKTVIRLLMLNGSYFPRAAAKRELFVTGEGLEIFSAMDDVYREDADFELTDLKDRLGENALNYLQQILDEIRIGEDDKKAFDDCMERLEQAKRARRITEIGDILSMADPDTDPVYIKQLTEELVTLNQMNKR